MDYQNPERLLRKCFVIDDVMGDVGINITYHPTGASVTDFYDCDTERDLIRLMANYVTLVGSDYAVLVKQ